MDIQKLKGHIPDKVLQEIPSVIETFQINTPLRLSHFLAQNSHESINFTATSENLNYSKDGLLKIFKKYFTPLTAVAYARKPEKIANLVYANRMGNGDEKSGDGWKFRGRGYIQLTGKNNYKSFSDSIKIDAIGNPDLVSFKYPLLSAAWFWSKNGLNQLSDKGSTDLNVTEITKKVNGGINGLADRIEQFKKFHSILK